MSSLLVFILSFFISDSPGIHTDAGLNEIKMKGITMVAPPKEFPTDPMNPIASINANYVALVPYGFSRPAQPTVYYNTRRQWWGERKEGVVASIKYAHQNGLKVMLKPQVFIPRSWVGEMEFKKEAEWLEWENSYRTYILDFAKVAAEEKVALFCIGTEYKIAAVKREKFWRELINEIRAIYSGKITYSSNWDSYKQIPFWDALDFIGLSAYFPLSGIKTPSIQLLKKEWKPIVQKLKRFSSKHQRKILFTEYGYLSVDYCADKNWELERKITALEVNETAQANACQALLESFGNERFWSGGFLWKWFPNMSGHEGYPHKDYTPQGKKAEATIRSLYGKI
jgi:hypothetical protein